MRLRNLALPKKHINSHLKDQHFDTQSGIVYRYYILPISGGDSPTYVNYTKFHFLV